MKVLVVSDSHSFEQHLREVLLKEKDCPVVFHLGDGMSEVERLKDSFPEKKFIYVKGNNDRNSDGEYYAYKYIEGNTIIATHGHLDSVNYSLYDLFSRAESVRANVALYGHTHKQNMQYDSYSGIYAINPGALCSGQYAVLSLTKDGVDVNFKRLSDY